jgi:hypothetical protein
MYIEFNDFRNTLYVPEMVINAYLFTGNRITIDGRQMNYILMLLLVSH